MRCGEPVASTATADVDRARKCEWRVDHRPRVHRQDEVLGGLRASQKLVGGDVGKVSTTSHDRDVRRVLGLASAVEAWRGSFAMVSVHVSARVGAARISEHSSRRDLRIGVADAYASRDRASRVRRPPGGAERLRDGIDDLSRNTVRRFPRDRASRARRPIRMCSVHGGQWK